MLAPFVFVITKPLQNLHQKRKSNITQTCVTQQDVWQDVTLQVSVCVWVCVQMCWTDEAAHAGFWQASNLDLDFQWQTYLYTVKDAFSCNNFQSCGEWSMCFLNAQLLPLLLTWPLVDVPIWTHCQQNAETVHCINIQAGKQPCWSDKVDQVAVKWHKLMGQGRQPTGG